MCHCLSVLTQSLLSVDRYAHVAAVYLPQGVSLRKYLYTSLPLSSFPLFPFSPHFPLLQSLPHSLLSLHSSLSFFPPSLSPISLSSLFSLPLLPPSPFSLLSLSSPSLSSPPPPPPTLNSQYTAVCNGQRLDWQLRGGHLDCVSSSGTSLSVQVLAEELAYNRQLQQFKMFIVDRPLDPSYKVLTISIIKRVRIFLKFVIGSSTKFRGYWVALIRKICEPIFIIPYGTAPLFVVLCNYEQLFAVQLSGSWGKKWTLVLGKSKQQQRLECVCTVAGDLRALFT